MARSAEAQSKFIVDYKDDSGKLESRWHYDYEKYSFGPILVEEFNLPKKEKRTKKKKVA